MIEEKHLDFGEAWEDSRFSWRIPIRNAGPGTVEVLDFANSCACFSIKPRSFSLANGETQVVEVELNLAAAVFRASERVRQFEATLVPLIKGRTPDQRGWAITGRVRKLLDFSASQLELGDVLFRGESVRVPTVKILADKALDGLAVQCTAKSAKAKVTGGPRNFELEISLEPLSPGPFEFDVELSPSRKEERLPTKRLRVTGIARGEVESVPGSLLLGALPVGQSSTQTILLVSRSGSPFRVQSWTVDSPAVAIQPLSSLQDPGNVHRFQVRQHVTQLGHQQSRVTFTVLADQTRPITVPLAISCYGRQAR